MTGQPAFRDVLDALLAPGIDAVSDESARSRDRGPTLAAFAPAIPLWTADVARVLEGPVAGQAGRRAAAALQAWAGSGARGPASDAPPVPSAPRPETPVRRARPLSVSERAALGRLRSLSGEPIDEVFTEPELRRVFRTLARRYHPDRHPHRSPEERRQLAERFAEAVAAYRQVTPALQD